MGAHRRGAQVTMSHSVRDSDKVSGSVAKSASITMFAGIISMAIGMVASVVLARSLGPEYKGRVDLVNNTVVMASMVFGLSFSSGITYVVARGGANFKRLAAILLLVATAQGVAAWGAMTLTSMTRIIGALLPPDYIKWGPAVVGAAAFATILTGYWRAFLSGMQRFADAAGTKEHKVVRLVNPLSIFGKSTYLCSIY